MTTDTDTDTDPGDTGEEPTDDLEATDDLLEEQTDLEPDLENTDRDISEARKYRKRAQEAEASVAELTAQNELMSAQVDTMRRALVEHFVGDTLYHPGDIWFLHPDVETFLDEQGDVDATRVAEVTAVIVRERPRWGPLPKAPTRPSYVHPQRPTGTDETPGQWAAALGGQSVL